SHGATAARTDQGGVIRRSIRESSLATVVTRSSPARAASAARASGEAIPPHDDDVAMLQPQNGRHERFHRTLKDETTCPPRANLPCQQRRFDQFRTEFNEERPHQALHGQSPAMLYSPSCGEWGSWSGWPAAVTSTRGGAADGAGEPPAFPICDAAGSMAQRGAVTSTPRSCPAWATTRSRSNS